MNLIDMNFHGITNIEIENKKGNSGHGVYYVKNIKIKDVNENETLITIFSSNKIEIQDK